jgi:hypothetical protein
MGRYDFLRPLYIPSIGSVSWDETASTHELSRLEAELQGRPWTPHEASEKWEKAHTGWKKLMHFDNITFLCEVFGLAGAIGSVFEAPPRKNADFVISLGVAMGSVALRYAVYYAEQYIDGRNKRRIAELRGPESTLS